MLTLTPLPWRGGGGGRRPLVAAGALRRGGSGGAGLWRGGGGVRRGGDVGLVGSGVLVAGVVRLVLELALDYLGLAATAGAENPLDVLVIGGQDGLQLPLEGVRLHFGVCIYHCAFVLKC